MRDDDLIRLKHMLDATKEALDFCKGKQREDLEQDRKLVLSLIRLVEIVGEAATKISSETKVKFSEIPWPQMIAMRHRLAHAYFDIDLDQVWDTVKEDLPPLLEKLQRIVSE